MPQDPTRQPADASDSKPVIVILAGVNGAGKTTSAPRILHGELALVQFLNADLIARGLSPFDPEHAALAASDVLLRRMESLTASRESFGLESTLAARSLAPRLRDLLSTGYEFHLVFLYLESAELAVARVANRVRLGGHNVPESTIRRRYTAGLRNFFRLYMPLATTWKMIDNTHGDEATTIAEGRNNNVLSLPESAIWNQLLTEYAN
jgi:predicted ABC-type ATPase